MKQEQTYIDLINELRKSIESDIISKKEKDEILLHVDIIANMLWKYSG